MSTDTNFPQTLQELLKTEDTVALQLQNTTGDLLRLVADFEKKHAALMHQQSQLADKSTALRGKISNVETAVKRLTFPPHMSKLGEIIKDFVDENSDLGSDPVLPSELVRFVNTAAATTSSGSAGEEGSNHFSFGLPPMSREEQMLFASLFADGGVLESRGGSGVSEAYFKVAGRVPPQPHMLTKAENPDEVLLDLAFVPFAVKGGGGGGGGGGDTASEQQQQVLLRRRSPLTDIAVMRCPAVGGRVLVSRRAYAPGALLFAERPFLSVPRSTTALLPMLPPLLQRVVNEMLVLPQAQTAMKHQGWDPQLVNCVLVYLAQQTYDAMARKESGDQQQQQGASSGGGGGGEQQQQLEGSQGSWMWRAPAPLFRYMSGDFLGEDPAATRRMRKLLFLGAPLQSMEAADVHRLHRLAQFVFAALPPCYRDFEGDESACRAAALEWARRGVTASFDTLELQQRERDQHKPGSAEAAKAAAQQLHMTPYDDNPAHRQVAVSPLGREACVAAEATGGGATAGSGGGGGDAADQSALQLPPECRVSVSDIARIFAVFQTNCITLRDDRSFVSTTVAGVESAAGRALSSKDTSSSTAASAHLSHPAPSAGLFTFMSLLEHSCCPNVVWCPSSSSSSSGGGGGELELRALRRIESGERLRVAYIPPILPAAQRRQRLKRSFLFECGCEACVGLDWSRPIEIKKNDDATVVSVPIAMSGDWVDVNTSSTTPLSSSSSSLFPICARGSGAAASRVRCETEAYSSGKRKQQQQMADDDDEQHHDEDEEEEDDDDDDTNIASSVREVMASRKMSKQPFKLVNEELSVLENIFAASSSSSSSSSASTISVHQLHIATYIHVMRLCTAWSYLLLACIPEWEQLCAEKIAPLSARVRDVTRRALLTYLAASVDEDLDEKSAAGAAKGKLRDAVSKVFGGDADVNDEEEERSYRRSCNVLPSDIRGVMLYSATLPLLENVAINATLEQVMMSNGSSSSSELGAVSEMWMAMALLIEQGLGWEKSPLAAKYRLYCANPKQCVMAPMEQPL